MEISDYLQAYKERQEVKADFHNHALTGKELGNELLQENLTISNLVKRIMNSDLNIFYLTDFEDARYNEWLSDEQLTRLRQEGYQVKQGRYFTFLKKDDKVKAIAKSQEIPTKQGHILFSGVAINKTYSNDKRLEQLTQDYDNELVTGDHPHACLGGIGLLSRRQELKHQAETITMPHFLSSLKSLYHNIRYLITGKLTEYQEQVLESLDALEQNGNYYFPLSLSNYLTLRTARKSGKPALSNTDGHHPKDIGNTYNEFNSEDLDYSSERTFRDSIHKAVKQGKFKRHFSRIPPWRIFHHVLMLGVYKIKQEISDIKEKIKRLV